MKTSLLWGILCLALLSYPLYSPAQQTSNKKQKFKAYTVKVHYMDGRPMTKGHLLELRDSSVAISTVEFYKNKTISSAESHEFIQEVPVSIIKKMTFRKSKATWGGFGKGAWIGALAGTAIAIPLVISQSGGASGIAMLALSGESPKVSSEPVFVLLGATVLGSIIGGLVTPKSKSIGGSQLRYNKVVKSLYKFIYPINLENPIVESR